MIVLNIEGINVPLPTDYTLSREIESNILKRDGSVADINYPVDIPLTDLAIQALGLPTNTDAANYKKTFNAQLYIDGIFLRTTTLNLLDVDMDKLTASVTLSGSYYPFSGVFGDKKVNEVFNSSIEMQDEQYYLNTLANNYGSGGYNVTEEFTFQHTFGSNSGASTVTVTYEGGYIYTSFLYKFATGEFVGHYAFPTCMDTNMNLPFVHDNAAISIINGFDDALQNTYMDGNRHYLRVLFESGMWGLSERHFLVPMFRLSYILKAVFRIFGIEATGDILEDDRFNNILVHNTFAINGVSVANGTLPNGQTDPYHLIITNWLEINPDNHMPDMKITDFLVAVQKRYNLLYVYDDPNKTVKVICLKDISAPLPNKVYLDNYAVNKSKMDFSDTDALNGYAFGDSNQATGTSIKDFSDKTYLGAVDSQNQITQSGSGYVYMRDTNQYYDLDELKAYDALGDYTNTTNTQVQEMKSDISALPMDRMTFANKEGSSTNTYFDVLMPKTAIGIEGVRLLQYDPDADESSFPSYIPMFFSAQTVDITATTTTVLSYYGSRPYDANYNYPFASTSYLDMMLNDLSSFAYVQMWHTEDGRGIYDEFWKQYAEALQAGYAINQDIKLPARVYASIDINLSEFWLNYQRYIAKKATFNMPYPAISTLSLVRI